MRFRFTLCTLVCGLSCLSAAQKPVIHITADLTDAPRKLFHADVDLPVHAGPLALITPEWIPGAHGPRGPVTNITGVVFTANGQPLRWRRDPIDTFEYHLTIPQGVSTLHAHLDCISPRSSRVATVLEWESLMLYPAHISVREIPIQATVKVPANWGVGTSMKPITPYDPQHPAGGAIDYAPTTVEMLEDSPVMTGAFFHEYPLATEESQKHFIDVIGSQESDTTLSADTLNKLSQLVRECFAEYGPPHYTSYHFLVLMTKSNGGGGLEHHESSDNSMDRTTFTGPDTPTEMYGLLPHEFTHSWNGKYRRPAGLATPDYATPMQDDLLWIYEGLTNYLGDMMAARVGFSTPEAYRQFLAATAAAMDAQSGRAWRSVDDTTFDSAMPRGSNNNGAWSSWQRGSDYYPEGSLLWLDADVTIRKQTGGKKSLRDFLQIFLQKNGSGVPRVEPYTLPEVIEDLNKVAPYDWAAFFDQRIYQVQSHVNTEGFELGGYRLVFTRQPSPAVAAEMKAFADLPAWLSVGLKLEHDGKISDVRVGSAADLARLAPGDKILAVNGHSYTTSVMTAAIAASPDASGPLVLTVQNDDVVQEMRIDYKDGLRYPTLQRIEGTPDLLSETIRPLASATPAQSSR